MLLVLYSLSIIFSTLFPPKPFSLQPCILFSNMDGERKKRKMDDTEAEEENEEEKMETFFALVRSTRDVRERMAMSNVDRLRLEEEEKRKKANENKQVAVWNPTFQPEDFREDYPHQDLSTTTIIPPLPSTSTIVQEEAGPSNSKKDDHQAKDQDDDDQKDKDGGDHYDLDLKLSL